MRAATAALNFRLGKDRPFQELAQCRIAADGFENERVVHVGRLTLADRTELAAERIEVAPAIAGAFTPHEIALPGQQWRR